MRKIMLVMVLLINALLLFGGASEEATNKGGVELNIVSHKVHENILRGLTGTGRDLIQEFIDSHPEVSNVNFITAGVAEVRDKLFREAALSSTTINIGFVYTPWITSSMPNYFTGLDEFEERNPLEEKEDIFDNLISELVIDNNLYAVPLRASGQGLFYNKEILKSRGIDNPPSTVEELIKDISDCTYTKSNGEKIYGISKQGVKEDLPFVVGDFVRSKNGDYVDRDLNLFLTDERVIWALDTFAKFYSDGSISQNFTAMSNSDSVELFKSGRAAFTVAGPGYLANFIGDGGLKEEDIGFINFPSSETIIDDYPVSPNVTFQWAMVIPKNSENKNLAWDLIQYVTTKDSILQTVLSGNEPVRESTFQNKTYIEGTPFFEEQKNIFTYGRPLFPGFDEYAEFISILGEEMQMTILGEKSSRQAMEDATRKINSLF